VQQTPSSRPGLSPTRKQPSRLRLAPAPIPASIGTPVPNAQKSQIAENDLPVNQWCNVFFSPSCFSSFSLIIHPSRPTSSPVKRSTTVAQAFRSLFRRDIALRLSHEFVADEEFPHSRAAQERRVEVDVEVGGFDFFGCACEGSLVEAHAYYIGLVAESIFV
jgi:hypothetical protein